MFGIRKQPDKTMYLAAPPPDRDKKRNDIATIVHIVQSVASENGFDFQLLTTKKASESLISKNLSSSILFVYVQKEMPSAIKVLIRRIGVKLDKLFCITPSAVSPKSISASVKPVPITAFFKAEGFSKEKVKNALIDAGVIQQQDSSESSPKQEKKKNLFSSLLLKNKKKKEQKTTAEDSGQLYDKEENGKNVEESAIDESEKSLLEEFGITDVQETDEGEEEIEEITSTVRQNENVGQEKQPKTENEPVEQVKNLIRSGEEESFASVNEQTIVFISPYSQAGTTILAENVVLSLAILNRDNSIPIAFVDFSFPPKATFHLGLSQMVFPLNKRIEISPVTIEDYWKTHDVKVLEKGSISIRSDKVRIFQAFGSKNYLSIVQRNPALITEFLNNLKTVYPIIVVSASNSYAQPFFSTIMKSATSVVEVMKYISNPLPDDIAEFIAMDRDIEKYNLESKIIVLNKVPTSLTRDERKMMNHFAPYVTVPEVPAVKMKATLAGNANFSLPVFIQQKDAQYADFNSAISEILNKFVGIKR